METTRCACGNSLFFESTHCVACSRSTGFCPRCRRVRPLDEGQGDDSRNNCTHCRSRLRFCDNYKLEKVCNGFVRDSDADGAALCDYCRLTTVTPDLTVDGNRQRWKRLEAAKRRVLFGIEMLGFDFEKLTRDSPLSFEFKADAAEPVMTGHAQGVITINIREADDVEREKSRVALGEPQRTLVGHFRHELGHYFWDQLVDDRRLERFRELFGDERNPTYADARAEYYRTGPPDGWRDRYLSAYCSMHPWEDFAESFAAYLQIRAVLDTAAHFGLPVPSPPEFRPLLNRYQELGFLANEWNRDIGLLDLVPEVFVAPAIEKLIFVHQLFLPPSTPPA